MNAKDKYCIYSVIIIISVITLFFIMLIFKNFQSVKGNPEDIAYTGKSSHVIDYNVFIKNNPYIEDDILASNNSFITSLIDKINLNFKYSYLFDRNINITYNYLIKADIVSLYNSDGSDRVTSPVWMKEYILKDQTDDFIAQNKIDISESLELNLVSYNDLVTNFIDDFNMPISSTLEIKLIINFNGDVNNKNISNEHYLLATIPLNVKAFDITTSTNFKEEETIYLNNISNKENIYFKIITYIVINLVLIITGYYYIKWLTDKYISNYLKEKAKILKNYDERIVEVTNFVKYQTWENVDVSNFEELLNLSNEAFEPIFFWERKSYHNREAWFCILRDKVLYRYIIYKNNDTYDLKK